MTARRHGMSKTKIYRCWKRMRTRCFNKNVSDYKYYGGRGIIICESWNVFEKFYEDMGDIPESKTLDRIDNNLGYNKENCRWSTRKEQANNRRSNILITHKGKTQNIMQWSEELGINFDTLYGRARRGKIIIS